MKIGARKPKDIAKVRDQFRGNGIDEGFWGLVHLDTASKSKGWARIGTSQKEK